MTETNAPLYHYTCAHGAHALQGAGILVPHPHPYFARRRLVWLTDMPVPDAEALGLTSTMLRCDRTEARYEVRIPDRCYRWREWAEHEHVPHMLRSALEFGCDPTRWWLSEHPQVAVRS